MLGAGGRRYLGGRVKKPRVVLDTNTFVAARFNPRSASARIIDLCIEGRCQAILSAKLRAEIESVLRRVRAGEEFRAKVQNFLGGARVVRVARELPLVMEDPEDNKFLNCAIQGGASYLVTSDHHLLKLGDYLGTRVCKPSQFLVTLGITRGRKTER